MHLLGQVILEEKNKETRGDILGQLKEFKRLQALKKGAVEKQDAQTKQQKTVEPTKKEVIVTKETPKPAQTGVPLTKGQKKSLKRKAKKAETQSPEKTEIYTESVNSKVVPDVIPEFCTLKKDYGRVTRASCTSIHCTGDSVYVGDSKGFLTKLSIASQAVDAKLGYVHKEGILGINTTADGEFVFCGDAEGNLKQVVNDTGECERDFKKIAEAELKCIEVEGDNLFIADMVGNLKHLSIGEKTIVNNYGRIHRNAVWGMKVTRDGTDMLFTCDGYGYLHQYNLKKQKLEKNYGFVHDSGLRALEMSWDSKYLFTMDRTGIIKQWSIADKKVIKETTPQFVDEIYATACSPKYLFVSDMTGAMKMFDIETLELVKDFEKAHDGSVTGMSITPNGQNLFTCDNNGLVYQWRINDNWTKKMASKKNQQAKKEIEVEVLSPRKASVTNVAPTAERKNSNVAPKIERQNSNAGLDSAELERHKKITARTNRDIDLINDKVNAVEMKVTDMSNKMNVMELKIDKLISCIIKN